MHPRELITSLPTHVRKLPNGLTVVVREIRTAPVVAIVTYVQVGYFDEPDDVVGISHVLEHMYFKGTARRGVGDIARETKSAGGYLNAGTIYDHTSYYTVLPADSLSPGLDIQADALRNSLIDADELRRELEVIVQEAKRKLDNPSAVASETLYETMFDAHRMRRWRIGREQGLRRLTRDHVHGFYRREYQPSRIVLVIAGDVEAAQAFDLAERHYGDMPDEAPPRDRGAPEPSRTGFRLREISGDIVEAYLELGWHTPGHLHPDTPLLDLLAVALGQGRASRLYRGVRERRLVTGIGADNYTPTDVGVFNISAELQPGDAPAAIEAVFSELAALRERGLRDDEMQRARNIVEARLLRRLETAEGQANLLAEWQAAGDWRLAGDYLERIASASAADLLRVAAAYLPVERATALFYRPAAAEPLPWDAAALERRLRATPAAQAAPPAPRAPSAAPAAHSPFRVRTDDDVHFFEPGAGLRLAVQPRRAAPLVSLAVAARGGVIEERPEQAGLTALMARTSLKGTQSRSAAQLAEETEALGGSISPSVSADLCMWNLSLPSRHVAQGFELLADAAFRPVFPQPELETERKVMLSDLGQLRDDMYRFPLHLFFEAAFPGHPYGYAPSVLETALKRHDAAAVAAWHARCMQAPELWAFVVGDVDPESAAEAVARAVARARSDGPRTAEAAASPQWPSEPRQNVETRSKAQTGLVLGFPGPDRTHEDVYALQVLANAVSGLGGRLFEELREKRSLAYTVTAHPVARWRAGAFIAYVATAPEREDEARQALLHEFARMRDVGVDAEDIERAKRYTIGTWQIRSQSNGAHLGDLAAALLVGTGLDEIREFESRIRAVTPEQVREAARRYFDPARVVQGIVRGGR